LNDPADTFQRLSVVLTGEADLDGSLVPGLIERLRREPEGSHLDRLLELFEGIVASGGDLEGQIESRIMADAELQALAVNIVLLWYLGDLRRPRAGNPPTEEQYFGAILWRIVRAHPPALSGGYFGQWTYPPD
jgi:D-sorbitol dehydrogenase-like protein